MTQNSEFDQMALFGTEGALVHYYDKNGALHTGRLIRIIKRGRKAGQMVVQNQQGKKIIPHKVRNVE
ncbi:hypothetical protein HQ585_06590 [candidate division KSB1 bacterium]|nr:hypothetical protein [candidate division KSB1 bacterium]